jgi:hypothetical protein
LTAWPLIRDTAFYSVALLLLVLFFVDDMIYWWEALVLFLWYGAYVLFMKFNVVAEAKFLSIFPSLKGKVRRVSSKPLMVFRVVKCNKKEIQEDSSTLQYCIPVLKSWHNTK